MIYDGIVIGLIVGLIRGGVFGALRGLSRLKLVAGWVFPALLVFQFVYFYFQGRNEALQQYTGISIMVIYVIGLLFVGLNHKQPGFKTIFVGVFLNFLVMVLNGGAMPVSLEAASTLGSYYADMLQNNDVVYKHAKLMEDTRLPFLGDIIPIVAPYPRQVIISIGDIVMNVGIFMFLQKIMTAEKKGLPSGAVSTQA
ncbi:hypothetical protein FE782_04990 [Paenibacillus antri]|uniref:DUF5317 domain-containing protein n=1 Tax=Paenibacillus antri TaxID=2582848 RepID=A0A5R9GHF3_9BACL|nr:DUF5317 domain-containing protein [Paenibacillus antri]TLS53630.1 hypothetical protein FE782_04990 [Paenibacillus antri]